MQKTRKLISMLLAVMMVLSMCTVGMMSVSALPEDAVINDVEGSDASGIDGEAYGLMGDADGDDKINVKDATQIQKFAAKLITLDEKCEALADVNLDGKVNVKDATAIQKWVAKFDVEEPINCLVYIPTVETEPTTAVVEPTSTPDEPATTASQEDTKPSVPVIVIPTTAEPTEAPSTAAPTTEAKPTDATDPKPTDATDTKPSEAPEEVVVYFQNNWLWSDVSVHMWTATGDVTTWPGSAMTFVENDGTYDIYSVVVPDGVVGMLFNGIKDDGTGTLDQTPDILEWHNGQCFYNVWDQSLNEGAGGNAVDSFDYIVPTEPTSAATQPATSATQDETDATEPTTEADDGMITVYFVKPANWANAYIYGFYGVEGETAEKDWPKAYPGEAMDFVETDKNGNDIYSKRVPADIDYIKFNDGTGTDSSVLRTNNIKNEALYDGVCFQLGASAGTNKWDVTTYDYPDDEEITTGTTEPDENLITVYFVKPANWANAYIYGFYGVEGETAEKDWPKAYPGEAMEFVETDKNGNDIYSKRVPADIDYIKFNDGTGTDSSVLRTNNIKNEALYDGVCFQLGASAGTNKWDATTYDYAPVENTTVVTDPAEDTTADTDPTDTTADTDPAETTATTDATDPKDDTVTIYLKSSGSDTDWVLNSTDRVVTMIDLDTQVDYTFTLGADGWYAEVPATVQNVRFHRVKTGSISHTWNASVRGEEVNFFITGDSTGHWENEDMSMYADVYLPGEFNGWDQGAYFTKTDDANVVTKTLELAAGTYKFKVLEGSTWLGNTGTINDTTTTSSTNGWEMTGSTDDCTLVATGGTYIFNFDTSTNKLIVLFNTEAEEPTTESEEPTTEAEEPTTEAEETTTAETTVVTDPAESSAATDPTDAPADTITVYFTNNKNWDVVNIHCWNSNGAITTWPGEAMTYYRTNGSGQDIYMYNVPVEAESIGFNGFPTTDSSDKSKQTVTITGADLVDGRGYYPDAASNDGRWTVGFWNESGVEDTTATEPTTPGESASYTVYFINGGNWDTVAAYVWDVDPLVSWPGTAMTKTGEQVNGFDVYSVTFDQEFPNIIFNNNDNGAQTDNLTMETGKYYDIKSKAWYDELSDVPAPSKTAANVFLPGGFNGWSTSNTEFTFNAEGDTICYVELDLAANTSYEFKVITYSDTNAMEWRGLRYTGTITGNVSDIVCSRSEGGNATIKTTSAGKYVFAFDTVNYTISITFPG